MPVVQAKPEPQRLDDKLREAGKYEISPSTTFTIQVHTKEKDGRCILMSGPGKGIDSNSVTFRMWTYSEMISLRKTATTYDKDKRVHIVDNDALNRMKVQKLMQSWTFDKDNPRLKLLHVGGILTDESWAAFLNLQPSIAAYILEMMNNILEGFG